ncbi:MAG TPA: hypothetical protein VK991_03070, partial [Halomonas sp.]|nr:hypothetical protein [Halomonas sp.]
GKNLTAWLQTRSHPGADADPCPAPEAVAIWNLMGGEIDWQALPLLAEIKGVKDIELLITGLTTIRDHFRAEAERERAAHG